MKRLPKSVVGKTILRNSVASSHVLPILNFLYYDVDYDFGFHVNDSQLAFFSFFFFENLYLKMTAWNVPHTFNWDTGEKH